MERTNNTQIKLKAYSIAELARIYEVDPRTLKKWIKPFEEQIGTKQGRYFQIPQVKIIFKKLDLPTNIKITN